MNIGEIDSPGRLAADVLVAFLRRNSIPSSELPDLAKRLTDVFSASQYQSVTGGIDPDVASKSQAKESAITEESILSVATPGSITPAVRVEDSIHDEYLVSLEDGKHYRSLRRHLMAKYGMTPDDYRAKWGLAPDYPMVAPSYARDRSQVAKRSGLGLSSGRRSNAATRRA